MTTVREPVIEVNTHHPSSPPVVRSPLAVLRRRLRGDYVVDEWGYDPDLVDLLDPLVGLGVQVEVIGGEMIPPEGPGLLVSNRRVGALEPFIIARGIRRSTGRRIRFLGILDLAPFGPALRRVGGAVHRPEELAGLLRAGHLCALPLTRSWKRRIAGGLAPESVAPALEIGAPVVPLALVGRELWGGRWRVFVGEPVPHPKGRGPLALADLADAAHDGVQALLDEAFPPRWLLG